MSPINTLRGDFYSVLLYKEVNSGLNCIVGVWVRGFTPTYLKFCLSFGYMSYKIINNDTLFNSVLNHRPLLFINNGVYQGHRVLRPTMNRPTKTEFQWVPQRQDDSRSRPQRLHRWKLESVHRQPFGVFEVKALASVHGKVSWRMLYHRPKGF